MVLSKMYKKLNKQHGSMWFFPIYNVKKTQVYVKIFYSDICNKTI